MRGDRRLTEPIDKLREKDKAVLRNISNGNDDVQKITSSTTLENHHVTYSFEKLEELGLIQVSKPEGTVERVIDGQKRVFQHPKQASLTEAGETCIELLNKDGGSQYTDKTHNELVEQVNQLENRIEELEESFKMFRSQVRDNLN
jgi:predicted transcriptional regulator